MKNYVLIAFAAVLAMGVFMACSSQNKKKENGNEDAKSSKYLVLYYSQTGVTKAVAEELQKKLGADIESIVVENPYSGTYDETIERVKQERADDNMPQLKALKTDISGYDVIFIGYPVWFGTYALPIATLVKENDFAGKKIVPFCTFGSGGLDSSVKALKAALPKAEIAAGYGVRSARITAMPNEVERFLKENGYIDGEVEPLPEYSAQQPVTAEEIAIFDTACSGYKYPLGKPVTVGKRTTSDGTDYKYTVNGETPDGKTSVSTIYVTVSKAEHSKPEFTQVVR
ncbi:MAG: flavodoxin [Prevotellaceae bacterium]|nr:flavodoxin [Prevotellaceae bacterium]